MKSANEGVFCLKSVKYFIILNYLIFLPFFTVCAKSDWTLIVFVQANNSLKNFAQNNFTAMGKVGSSADLNILVQCYFPQNAGVYRYKIEKNKMVLDSHIQEETDGTMAKDLVDAFRWAVNKYPAKKYALILWNHGIGILDPSWGKINPWHSPQRFYIEQEMLAVNPRIHINELTVDHTSTDTSQALQLGENTFTEEEIILLDKAIEPDFGTTNILRGILFNEKSRTYMTNQTYMQALEEIKFSVLKGKKIDLLGMDACLMAMIEVGYHSRQFADYLVASEESELAHGWDYESLCKMLSEKQSPKDVACGIVLNYELFYKNKINFYTLSAVDLSCMDILKSYVDLLAKTLQECKKIDKNTISALIKKARTSCQQFSASNYIDLHSFLIELRNQINLQTSSQNKLNGKAFLDLKDALQKNITLLERAIIANTAGKLLARARGLSIYFPLHHVDYSYLQTEFGVNSYWTNLIKDFLSASS